MPTTTQALQGLRRYCKMAMRHSHRQYESHGPLLGHAQAAMSDPQVWSHRWVPEDFDLTDAASHPVWQGFDHAQKLAWNHLQWTLDYSTVAQGERQIIVLNRQAVRAYRDLMPEVVELEERECFEEIDHVSAFEVVFEAVRRRYMPRVRKPASAVAASGFRSDLGNRLTRRALGRLAHHLLGANFPTLFFLARGMKTHGFKPFENAIAAYEPGHVGLREVSRLHRLDESRHMATALQLARLSNQVLETAPRDNRLLFRQAVSAAFPPGRSADYRMVFWRRTLHQAEPFRSVPRTERDALLNHMQRRLDAQLRAPHPLQTRLTRQANKRIVEDCGLSPELKRLFVQHLRQDPAYAATLDGLEM